MFRGLGFRVWVGSQPGVRAELRVRGFKVPEEVL